MLTLPSFLTPQIEELLKRPDYNQWRAARKGDFDRHCHAIEHNHRARLASVIKRQLGSRSEIENLRAKIIEQMQTVGRGNDLAFEEWWADCISTLKQEHPPRDINLNETVAKTYRPYVLGRPLPSGQGTSARLSACLEITI